MQIPVWSLINEKNANNALQARLLVWLADCTNMVEGIIDDLKTGHFPNIIAERGWAAEWKYNRKAVVNIALTKYYTLPIGMTKAKR